MEILVEHINQKVSLTEEEISILLSKLTTRTYSKGEHIVQFNEICRYQTFVLKGKARTYYLDDKGNEHIVAFGVENWWVGDICSFANQTPAEFSTECLEQTEVVHISYDDMQQLYQETPKLERYFRMIVQSAYGSMSKRIIRNHAMPARDRYLLFIESYPEIVQRIPQYMIASYLGITKEFLSTIRKQIAEEGIS